MGAPKYNEEMTDRIAQLKGQLHGSYGFWSVIAKTISSEFGIQTSAEGCRNALKHVKDRPNKQPSGFYTAVSAVIQDNERKPKDIPWDEMLDSFETAKSFRKNFDIGYRHVKCHIKTKTPIAISWFSDIHIGSPACDYQRFKKDISEVISDGRIYVGKGGDWGDKMGNFRDAQARTNQLHPEKIQLLTIEKIMEALDGRIIAAVGGNHDTMDARKTGLNSEYWIHRGKGFPYMPTGGLVELTVGKATYRILWTHQYGAGNSRLNKHNVFRWLRQELGGHADIFVLEHHHDPSILTHEMAEFDGRVVTEIRTGSYKLNDKFSEQFYKRGRPGPQTVVLYPDRKKVVGFHSTDGVGDARIYLDGVTKRG